MKIVSDEVEREGDGLNVGLNRQRLQSSSYKYVQRTWGDDI